MLNEYRTQAQSVVQTAQAQADEDNRAWQSGLNANNMQYSRSMEQAEMRSKYGDFSGYENLYGADTANNMRQAWIASNPDLAYNTGAIDAKRYREITGKYPKGYSTGGGSPSPTPVYSGGGGGGGGTANYGSIAEAAAAVRNGTAPANYTLNGKAVSDATAGFVVAAANSGKTLHAAPKVNESLY